jgi:hypothetical protein
MSVQAPASIVWVVERPWPDEAPEQIAWCTTDRRAREITAAYWRFHDWEERVRITIVPCNMDAPAWECADVAFAAGWTFDGDEASARTSGWLDANGELVGSYAGGSTP